MIGELFHNHLGIKHSWDKAILLSPLDHTWAFEIQSVSDDSPGKLGPVKRPTETIWPYYPLSQCFKSQH